MWRKCICTSVAIATATYSSESMCLTGLSSLLLPIQVCTERKYTEPSTEKNTQLDSGCEYEEAYPWKTTSEYSSKSTEVS